SWHSLRAAHCRGVPLAEWVRFCSARGRRHLATLRAGDRDACDWLHREAGRLGDGSLVDLEQLKRPDRVIRPFCLRSLSVTRVWKLRAKKLPGLRLPASVLWMPVAAARFRRREKQRSTDRKSTRLHSSHEWISYAVFCL